MRPFVLIHSAILSSGALAAWATGAVAADASFEGSTSTTMSTSDQAPEDGSYLTRYKPFAGALEIGGFAGLLFISDNNSFRRAPTAAGNRLSLSPYSEFKQPSPELGIRVGYYPLSFLGAELEGMAALAGTQGGDDASAVAARAQAVIQLPKWSVVPFILGGAGYWAVQNDVSGNDVDPAFHFGGGVKVAASGNMAFRLDLRDTITNQGPGREQPNHIEVSLGASVVLGRPDPAPRDSDGDGFIDFHDSCPTQAGVDPDGCPVRDADGDQVPDSADQCPTEAGPAPAGCPVPESVAVADVDSDGVEDSADECMTVPGIPPTGCPGDTDGDGLRDDQDKCPSQAETSNGFEDEDGCPDEVPENVKRFSGAIDGIEFATNQSEIRPGSRGVLEEAARVLNEHPSLRVEIVGHTDDSGSREHNLDLSLRRAESVKAYLVGQGIEASRIEVRGAGPDEPLVAEKTREARQKNRRIEFRVLRASDAKRQGPSSTGN